MNANVRLKDSLSHGGSEKRAATLRQKLLWIGIGIVGVLVVSAFIDYSVIFSKMGRWFLFLIVAGVGLWRFLTYQQTRREGVRTNDLAREIEKKAEDDRLVVSTAAQVAEVDDGDRSEVASHLRENLFHQADEVVSNTKVDHQSKTMGVFAILGAVLALFLGFGAAKGWTAIQRVLAPWSEITYTQVELDPVKEIVKAGEPVELRGEISGREVEDAVVRLSDGRELPVDLGDAGGSFVVSLPSGVQSEVTAVVSAGDGISNEVTLRVEEEEPITESPGVESYLIKVTPVDDPSLEPEIVTEPTFSVRHGSQIDYRVKLISPAKRVTMIRTNSVGIADGEVVGELLPEGGSEEDFKLLFEVKEEDVFYRLRVEGVSGKVFENEIPHHIAVRTNEPPKVVIQNTNAEDIWSELDEFKFEIKASDDVAVRRLQVKFHKVGEPARYVEVGVNQESPKEFVVDHILALADLHVEPLDIVSVVAIATDGNKYPGPAIVESEPFLLEIPEAEEDGEGSEQEGGGGSGEQTMINPLEIQMEIYKDTSTIFTSKKKRQFDDLRVDQDDNVGNLKGFKGFLLEQIGDVDGVGEVVRLLDEAIEQAGVSSKALELENRDESMVAQEHVIKNLVDLRKMMEEAEMECPT